ncbi:MAG: DUF4276 family protein [Acidobacteriota bacterium]
MKIQPVVEGYGDVDAVPVLVRRLLAEAGVYEIDVGRPIRRKISELHTQTGIQRAVQLAMLQPGCSAVLFLFDSEDSCPRELAPVILGWARQAAAATPCCVVLAYREYETWFLASIESLRGKCGIRNDAEFMSNFESRRGAKEALEGYMPKSRSYHETTDQARLTAAFDMMLAYGRSRSFRKMVKSVGDVLTVLGATCAPWPPLKWTQGA